MNQRILLDTHIYLWCLCNAKLSRHVKQKISDAEKVFVSSASIWEAAMKINLGKLHADIDQIKEAIVSSGFNELPITANHAAVVAKLTHLHRDPFDRILVAQALSEPLTLLTADPQLQPYSGLITLVTIN